ncbi:MAG: T9SS type A sorting domain-containing protein [Ignavibacterium sp.]|nr:T9SS type A sorting domain-containing protein [Ignavibacterium sp.]MDW8374865.1 T9SS type A sorting domain-containing protein [Ignavibacteriales bacterium]
MKKLLIVLLLLLFGATEIYSQWVAQTSGTTVRIRQVKAVNDNVVWACGNNGVVLRTTNGGTTWELRTPTDPNVINYSIDALDAEVAWVTGTVGGTANFYIWKTTNGGTSWVQQYNNPNGFGDAIRFFNANEGICYADPDPYPSTYWEILRTTNGGTTWVRVPRANIPPADSVNGEYGAAGSIDIFGNNVWFTSYYSSNVNPTKVYRSTDKGLTWTVTGFNQQQGYAGSSYVAFANANNGIVVCLDGTVARTTNGGSTWTTSTLSGVGFRYIVNVPNFNLYLAVGNSGVSYYTTNGIDWVSLPTGTTQALYGIDATSNFAWAVGNNGTILKFSGPPLPVELTSFTASLLNSAVKLEWTTASELNNHGFEIQRKTKYSDTYVSVGFVKGAGTTTAPQTYSFIDRDLLDGSYIYRLKQIDFNGLFHFSDEIEIDVRGLNDFVLEQNYHNQFNQKTKIGYVLKERSNVKLSVYNLVGEEVAVLINEPKEQGYHRVDFDAKDLPSGVYVYKLSTDNFTSVKKMVLMK